MKSISALSLTSAGVVGAARTWSFSIKVLIYSEKRSLFGGAIKAGVETGADTKPRAEILEPGVGGLMAGFSQRKDSLIAGERKKENLPCLSNKLAKLLSESI